MGTTVQKGCSDMRQNMCTDQKWGKRIKAACPKMCGVTPCNPGSRPEYQAPTTPTTTTTTTTKKANGGGDCPGGTKKKCYKSCKPKTKCKKEAKGMKWKKGKKG